MTRAKRTDIYTRVTLAIVDAIERGAGEFKMPWHCPGAPAARPANVVTGRAYRGINALALWSAAQALSQPTHLWGTYEQWRTRGAGVRRGERATTIVFWKSLSEDDGAPIGDESKSVAPPGSRVLARGYSVFNECQVEGYSAKARPALDEDQRLWRAEAFWNNLGIETVQSGGEAYYDPARDRVVLPPFSMFIDVPAAYAVRFHEGAHATGAGHRCRRLLDSRFGSEAYAMEELCAELGSALVLADLEIGSTLRPDHARYIASWLKVLRADVKAVFRAASQAQIGVDWMHAQQRPGRPAGACSDTKTDFGKTGGSAILRHGPPSPGRAVFAAA